VGRSLPAVAVLVLVVMFIALAGVLAAYVYSSAGTGDLVAVAYAESENDDGDEYDDDYGVEEEEDDEYDNDVAEAMGEVAFYGGLMLNGAFVAVRWARRLGVAAIPPAALRLAMELHMDGNVVLALLALTHGYVFLGEAGPLEYSLAALVVLLTGTGLVMRYYRGRRARLVARLVHSQRVLALLLLALAALHVAARD